MVDAPVSGAEWGAKAAELVFMVGGAAADSSACGRCSTSMGKAVFHLGPLGAGHAMKCLNNLITAINFLAIGEGLAIGKRYGLDPAAMVDVLERIDRHVVDLADAHPPARPQPQLRRSVQARADGQGHRHRDAARPRSVDVPAPLSARTRSSGAPPPRDAAPDASVSELVRWVERMTQAPRSRRARRRARAERRHDDAAKKKLRSAIVNEGLDRAPHRAFLRATGMGDEDMAKPFVGIVSQHGENTPCSMSLGPQADAARLGVAAARRRRRCSSRPSRSPTACR